MARVLSAEVIKHEGGRRSALPPIYPLDLALRVRQVAEVR